MRPSRRGSVLALLPVVAAAACRAGGGEVARVPDACAVQPVEVRAVFTPIQPDSSLVKFAGITRAEVDRHDRLVILDGSGPVLFAVDTLGRTTVVLDKAGPGPGELNDPRAFAFDAGGHVWVVSPSPPLIAEFDSARRHVRSLRHDRAAMVSDMAIDSRNRLYLAYRVLNPGTRYSSGGGSLTTIERLVIEGDSVRGETLDSVTAAALDGPPFFNAPIVEYALAASRTGDVVSTTALAYHLTWLPGDASPGRSAAGCQDDVDNEASLRQSTMRSGGYTMITQDLAFTEAGDLVHLTANIRADSTQRLDVFGSNGVVRESLLIPSRRKGGTYLSALLPTSNGSLYWGYESGGQIWLVRIAR